MDDLAHPTLETDSWQAVQDFLRAAEQAPESPAITAAGQTLSYAELRARVMQLAATLAADERAADAPVTAIYLNRGIDTYAAVLAALLRGHAYVPLNPKFPPERNRYILDRSGATALFHAPEDAAAVQKILAADSGEPNPAQPRCLAMGALPQPPPPCPHGCMPTPMPISCSPPEAPASPRAWPCATATWVPISMRCSRWPITGLATGCHKPSI